MRSGRYGDTDPVATAVLGPVEGSIRPTHDLAKLRSVVIGHDDTDGDGDI